MSQLRLRDTERITERERQLRGFVERLPVAVAMFDRDMRYLSASARWRSDYHLDDSIIGRSHYDVFPEIPERWRAIHRRGLNGEVVREDEECFVRADGSRQWLKWEVQPWLDGAGNVGGIIIYSEELTDRKLMEERLMQSQRLETIGRLSGGIAHDFNNLLTVIVGNAEVLRDQDEIRQELRQLATHIVGAGDRAAELTRRLLAFSRRQVLAPTRVDLNKLVASSVKLVSAPDGGAAIETILDPEAPMVHADESQLRSAILNLVVNAQEAANGRGRVSITTGKVIFGELQTEVAPGGYGLIQISDDGIGMTDEVKSRAFEPFFTTKEFGTSSGLGLSMVYGFAKQSDGHVSIDSRAGIGTTVRLYLPLVATASAEKSAPKRMAAAT